VIAANTRRRQIGGIGTAARVVLGLAFVLLGVTGGRVSVMHGQVGIGFEPISVAVGLVGFPAVVLAWQWIRARVAPTRLEATGPGSTALNMLVLAALLLTLWYTPPFSFTSVAALVFYGASMLLAALRAPPPGREAGKTYSKTPASSHKVRGDSASSLLRSGISKPAESENYVLKSHTLGSTYSMFSTPATGPRAAQRAGRIAPAKATRIPPAATVPNWRGLIAMANELLEIVKLATRAIASTR